MHTAVERTALREIALASIRNGLTHGRPLALDAKSLPPSLAEPGASFVTLEIRGRLRGCIGSLQAHRALAVDVADNAFAAAFRDSRFPPLDAGELPSLDLHVSVLTKPVPMSFRDEADLLAQLRPGIDGLILSDGPYRGTFLPSVWEQLPDRRDFLAHLKRKAGLPTDHWSPSVQVLRYETEIF